MPKKPIDAIRDSAFFMNIDDPDDPSPLREIIPLSDMMLIVKDRSIWQVQLADAIDPERKNISIPNTRQKLMKRGVSDVLVCRTLLQAKHLLKAEFLSRPSEPSQALLATVSFLQELDALQCKADNYSSGIDRLNKSFNGASARQKGLNLPAVGDVRSQAKSFIQAADHTVKTLWQLVRTFEPTLPPGVNWQRLKSRFHDGDEGAKNLAKIVGALEGSFAFLRNTRNAVEHEKPRQRVIVQDYKLLATGHVTPPTITIVEKNSPLSETDLSQYFAWVVKFLVDAFEALLINLCAANLKPFGKFEVVLTELEVEQRRYPSVAYSYAMWMGDRLVRYGN